MKRALTTLLLLIPLWGLSGCASPETYDQTPVRILAAFPGLTWVDGDPEEGTTTLLSLPLLTYRSTQDGPGYRESRTCVLPVLGRFEQTDRFVHLVWKNGDRQAKGPPDDEDPKKKKKKKRRSKKTKKKSDSKKAKKKKKKGYMRIEAVRPRRARGLTLEPDRPRGMTLEPRGRRSTSRSRKKRTRRPTRRKKTRVQPVKRTQRRRPTVDPLDSPSHSPKPKPKPRPVDRPPEPPPGKARTRGQARLVLTLDRAAKILRQKPQQRTDINVLFPLLRIAAERPALVAVREEGGQTLIYEVGESSDAIRFLPLFSFERTPRGKSLILWPLLASGYESEGDKSYLRLFYFLKIPLN